MFQKTDILKAIGVALIIMAVDVAISVPVVAVYAYFIEPGHDATFYEAAAQRIAPWSSLVAGAFLLRREHKPERPREGYTVVIAEQRNPGDSIGGGQAGRRGQLPRYHLRVSRVAEHCVPLQLTAAIAVPRRIAPAMHYPVPGHAAPRRFPAQWHDRHPVIQKKTEESK